MTSSALLVRIAAVVAGAAFAVALTTGTAAVPARQPAAQKKDPLVPTGPKDIVSDPSGCIRCHGHENAAAAKQDPFAMQHNSHEFVLLTESKTWKEQDLHSRTFDVLKEPLGRRMSEVLKYDVTKSAKCLTCHGIDKYGGSPLPAGEIDVAARFEMGAKGRNPPGVTCNVCHGLRPKWQDDHWKAQGGDMTWRKLTPAEKAEAGMRDLRNPVVKAALCVSCHVGNAAEGKVITHEMYAADHPPLPPFELAAYMEAEPKHWGYPTQLPYFKTVAEKDHWRLFHFHSADKESYLSRHYAVGAAATLRAEAELLLADAELAAKGGDLIDYARFDCYACHHDIPDEARQKRGYEGPPGRPPLRASSAVPARLVAKHAEAIDTGGLKAKAVGFEEKWAELRKAATAKPFGDPKRVKESAKEVIDWCNGFLAAQSDIAEPIYTATRATGLRDMIRDTATGPAAADPEAAFALAWGYRTLAAEAGMKNPQANDKLAIVIPLNVRVAPFTSGGKTPQPTPAAYNERMRRINSFDAGLFRDAFGGLPK